MPRTRCCMPNRFRPITTPTMAPSTRTIRRNRSSTCRTITARVWCSLPPRRRTLATQPASVIAEAQPRARSAFIEGLTDRPERRPETGSPRGLMRPSAFIASTGVRSHESRFVSRLLRDRRNAGPLRGARPADARVRPEAAWSRSVQMRSAAGQLELAAAQQSRRKACGPLPPRGGLPSHRPFQDSLGRSESEVGLAGRCCFPATLGAAVAAEAERASRRRRSRPPSCALPARCASPRGTWSRATRSRRWRSGRRKTSRSSPPMWSAVCGRAISRAPTPLPPRASSSPPRGDRRGAAAARHGARPMDPAHGNGAVAAPDEAAPPPPHRIRGRARRAHGAERGEPPRRGARIADGAPGARAALPARDP